MMRRLLLAAALALTFSFHLSATCRAFSGDSGGNYLTPGVIADILYRPGLTLDAYSPAGARRPAALLIHGSSGDKATHITQLFPELAKAGYAWFSVDYRNAQDLREAEHFITCPGRFAIQDPLTLIAEDTGVPAALQLAAADPRILRVIGFGAPGGLRNVAPPHAEVLLFHGDADDESPLAAVRQACSTWTNCRLYPVPHGIHNFENWHPDQWEWREELAAVLRNGRGGLWKDIVYARPGGLPLLMDAYRPEGPGPFPAIVIAHGGGWEAGDKVTYISPVLAPLARAGYAWFSIDYRLTPYVRNADQLEDLRNAIRYVRAHAARYRIDPQRLAALGESASGQMVTQIASEPCSGCDLRAVVSFYGVYDFAAWANTERPMLDRIFGSWDLETLRRYSPLFHVHAGIPPVLLLQGTGDELYPGTLAYEKALAQAAVPHQLILLKDAPHGMENWAGHPAWSSYVAQMLTWLRENLKE